MRMLPRGPNFGAWVDEGWETECPVLGRSSANCILGVETLNNIIPCSNDAFASLSDSLILC